VDKNGNNRMESDIGKLILEAIGKFSFLFILLGLVFFLPAGTIFFWEAWLFIGIFLIMMLFFLRYMVKYDPDLLRRRLQTGEKRKEQNLIIKVSNTLLVLIFLIPGFDRRWEWSLVPTWAVILADVIFAIGYILFFLVLRENSFASRTIQVEENAQKLVTTGPYSKVRHPMYSSVLIMFGIMPMALGSYWGLVSIPILLIMMYFRVRDEEKMLKDELPGYNEYSQKTKYRIIPFIW